MSELFKDNPIVKVVMLKGQDGEEKLINQADGSGLSFWIGTQAEYDAIPEAELISDCVYFITDDTRDDFNTRLNELDTKVDNLTTNIADYVTRQGTVTQGSRVWTYELYKSGKLDLRLTINGFTFDSSSTHGTIKTDYAEVNLPYSELRAVGINVNFINQTFSKEAFLSAPDETGDATTMGYWIGTIWYTTDDYLRIGVYTTETTPTLTDGIIYVHIVLTEVE